MRCVRHRAVSSVVASQAHARELPARMWVKEIAIRRPNVVAGCGARGAAQHELIAHELAVVLTVRTAEPPEAGTGDVGRGSPFPRVAEALLESGGVWRVARVQLTVFEEVSLYRQRRRGDFPLGLRR